MADSSKQQPVSGSNGSDREPNAAETFDTKKAELDEVAQKKREEEARKAEEARLRKIQNDKDRAEHKILYDNKKVPKWWDDEHWVRETTQACKDFDYRGSILMAPMVNASKLSLRLEGLRYGADRIYSEEVFDFELAKARRYYNKVFDKIDYICGDSARSWGKLIWSTNQEEARRVALQLGTSEACSAVKAAIRVAKDVGAIDINCGCPKDFSIRRNMGAALLDKPEVVEDILKALRRNLPAEVQVTAKIRLLEDEQKTITLLNAIQRSGAVACAVHCRQRSETSYKDCPARWHELEHLKQAANMQIPILINGDLTDQPTIETFDAKYPGLYRDGVMIARGAMFNPSIFRTATSVRTRRQWLDANPDETVKSINCPVVQPMLKDIDVASQMMNRCQDTGEFERTAHYNVRQILFGRNYRTCDKVYLTGTRDNFPLLVEKMSTKPYTARPLDKGKPVHVHRHDFSFDALKLNMQVNRFDDNFEVIERCEYHDKNKRGSLNSFPQIDRNPYTKALDHTRLLNKTTYVSTNSTFLFAAKFEVKLIRQLAVDHHRKPGSVAQDLVGFLNYCRAVFRPSTGKLTRIVTCAICKTIDQYWGRGDVRCIQDEEKMRKNDEKGFKWYCETCWPKVKPVRIDRSAENTPRPITNGDSSSSTTPPRSSVAASTEATPPKDSPPAGREGVGTTRKIEETKTTIPDKPTDDAKDVVMADVVKTGSPVKKRARTESSDQQLD